MGLLLKVVGLGARATGRALSAHVVPDSLVPSWKTQKRLSSGLSLLNKAAKRVAGKKKSNRPATAPTKNRALAGVARPSSKPPKKSFNQNAWSTGRGLESSFDGPPPSRSNSRSVSPARNLVSKRLQQAKDVVRNPRIVAQMGLDLLKVDYQHKKANFLSKLKHAVQVRKILR